MARTAAAAAAADAERDAALARVGKVRQQQEAAAAKWAAGDVKAKARTPDHHRGGACEHL